MIRDGTRYMLVAPHMVMAPGMAILAVVLSVNLLGDAYAPGTIAAAVYSGHKHAQNLDKTLDDDAVPFRREMTMIEDRAIT